MHFTISASVRVEGNAGLSRKTAPRYCQKTAFALRTAGKIQFGHKQHRALLSADLIWFRRLNWVKHWSVKNGRLCFYKPEREEAEADHYYCTTGGPILLDKGPLFILVF